MGKNNTIVNGIKLQDGRIIQGAGCSDGRG